MPLSTYNRLHIMARIQVMILDVLTVRAHSHGLTAQACRLHALCESVKISPVDTLNVTMQ